VNKETQHSLYEYKPKKDIFDVLNEPVKNIIKIDFVRTYNWRNQDNIRIKGSLILSELKFDLVAKAVFEPERSDRRGNPEYSRESLVKAIIWKRYCNIKRTFTLVKILSENNNIASNLGFEEKIPSIQKFHFFEGYLFRDNIMKRIIFKIIKIMKRESRSRKWK